VDRVPLEEKHESGDNTFDQFNAEMTRNAFGSFVMANETGELERDLIKDLVYYLKSKNITVQASEDDRAALTF
jgi:hypothetical protein